MRPSSSPRPTVTLAGLRRAATLTAFNLDRLAPAVAGAATWLAVPGSPGPAAGALAAALLMAAVHCSPLGARLRTWCQRSRRMERLCSRVRRSCLSAGLPQDLRVSTVQAASGAVATVHTPLGLADAAIAAHAPALASDLRAWRVTVLPENRHGRVRFLIQMDDPLGSTPTVPWLPAERGSWSMTSPVPVGVREDGAPAELQLWSQTTLVGGSPGSGKSVFGWLPLLGAALDPSAVLVVLDLKPHGIETAPIAERADHSAHTAYDARHLLSRVWLLILQRNRLLRELGLEKVPTDDRDNFPPVVIFVDEAAELSMTPEGQDALVTLQRIVAVGRASGVSVVLMTQKPDATTVPTSLRDLFAQRVAFRVGNRAQAETILGVIPDGARPWEVAVSTPGVGFLLGDDGRTVRFRSTFLDRAAVSAVAEAAAAQRRLWVQRRPDGTHELPSYGEEPLPQPKAKRKRRRS